MRLNKRRAHPFARQRRGGITRHRIVKTTIDTCVSRRFFYCKQKIFIIDMIIGIHTRDDDVAPLNSALSTVSDVPDASLSELKLPWSFRVIKERNEYQMKC
jgi:hypothetical protein